MLFLTQFGKSFASPDPINLPHAEPINRDGINSPLDMDRPKVATAKKK